jgi:hypothetical protein
MRKPMSVRNLEQLGRVRLSSSFFLRDFLHSEIADLHAIPNIPDDPNLAIAAGRRLCEELLEPMQATFGRLAIRSAYRAPAVNAFGNAHGLSCASNERNYARHIWDRRDARGCMGALATVVVPCSRGAYLDFAGFPVNGKNRREREPTPRRRQAPSAGPMVRIRLPPGVNPANPTFLAPSPLLGRARRAAASRSTSSS